MRPSFLKLKSLLLPLSDLRQSWPSPIFSMANMMALRPSWSMCALGLTAKQDLSAGSFVAMAAR